MSFDAVRKGFLYMFPAAFLMLLAIYNGYPIIAGDSAAYISSGFEMKVPIDRPIFYGLFLRIFSLGQSLWLPVFVQCSILYFLLAELIRKLLPEVSKKRVVVVVILISLTTIGGWHASQIMPDVFAPVAILAFLNYIREEGSTIRRQVYLLILFLSIIMHNSHILIFTLLCLVVLLSNLIKRIKFISLKRQLMLYGVCILGWLTMSLSNYWGGNGFNPSKATHVFLMGKLVETGILKIYLDKNCDLKHYRICTFKDSLPPAAWEFVWDAPSPLYKTGGWDSNKNEYNAIFRHILSKPQYWLLMGYKAMEGTMRQLITTDIDGSYELSWIKYQEDSPPYEVIKKYIPHELNEMKYAKLNTKTLNVIYLDRIFIFTLIVSSLLVLWYGTENLPAGLRQAYIWIIICIVINAFVTATFANVLCRLNTRVIWLIPFMNFLLLYHLITNQRKNRTLLSQEQPNSQEK